MAKPLTSRGELESSYNAGIFRWQKSDWLLGKKKYKGKKGAIYGSKTDPFLLTSSFKLDFKRNWFS